MCHQRKEAKSDIPRIKLWLLPDKKILHSCSRKKHIVPWDSLKPIKLSLCQETL